VVSDSAVGGLVVFGLWLEEFGDVRKTGGRKQRQADFSIASGTPPMKELLRWESFPPSKYV